MTKLILLRRMKLCMNARNMNYMCILLMCESCLQERLGSREGRSETEKDVVTSCFPIQEGGSNAVILSRATVNDLLHKIVCNRSM